MMIDKLEHRDLASVLRRRVNHCPDKPWIVTAESSYSYRQMDQLSGRLAQGMINQGIKFGDTVLIILPNIEEFILTWCGISKIGAIEVPVNVHNRGNPLSYLINDSLARFMIIDVEYLDRIESIKDSLSNLGTLILYDKNRLFDHPLVAKLSNSHKVIQFDQLYADEMYSGPAPEYHNLMGVLYTSGTTGPSKGVTMSHAHAYEYAFGVTEMLELEESDIYCAPLPLFHIAGQFATIYASCIAAATAVISDTFSAKRFWTDIRHHNVTCTFLLGAMGSFLYRQPVNADDADNTLDRVLLVPLIPEVEDFKKRFDCRVSTTWGGTEMNCPTQSGFELANIRTCGKLVSDRYEIRIVDEMDIEVPNGTPGEALVRARTPWILTNGYWNHPEWTTKAWRNLWYHTGDMLMRDDEGNYYFVDRTKDAIRRRGENISSMEVENEINSHPAVLECAVIPVEASESEQEVRAIIVLKEGKTLDHEEFIRFIEPRMAYFMVPRYIDLIDALPKTPTGKIQKFVLKEHDINNSTWDREAAGIKLTK